MNIKIDITLCRVCLKEGSGTNIHTGTILEKFQFTTLVQVEKNDGLSEIICKKCLARLQIAYDFKREAIASNRELRSFISNVNKQFQQVTSSTSVKLKQKTLKVGGSESYDELDEDMQELLEDEQDVDKESESDLSDENKKTMDRDQLVEILGDNNGITILKPGEPQILTTIQEDVNEEAPVSMEVFLVEENSEVESGYILDEYDQNDGEFITDDTDEQYLEEDDNEDPYDMMVHHKSKPKGTPQKSAKTSSSSNPDNRCDVCNKTFSTRTNLTRHRITHDGRKPYVCNICGNSFTQNGSLKSHMFIHTGERPFDCKVCGKAFTQSKSLVFHMRRHTGEKPFPCDHCGIKFRQKDGLKRHVAAKHAPSRSKYHICDVCGKVLLSKYSMNMHRSRHSSKEIAVATRKNKKLKMSAANSVAADSVKETPKVVDVETVEEWDELYACGYCEQAFSNSNELMEHREIHTEINEEHSKYMEDSC